MESGFGIWDGEQVGCAPGEAGCGVFDEVARVVEGVEGASFSEGGDGLPGGGQGGFGAALAEEFGDDEQPEVGEGFVVAGGGRVGSADGEVVGADSGAHEGKGDGELGAVEVVRGGGYVSGVGPLGFWERASFKGIEEPRQILLGGEVLGAHDSSLVDGTLDWPNRRKCRRPSPRKSGDDRRNGKASRTCLKWN